MISSGSGEIGAEAFPRERRLEPVQKALAVGKPVDVAVPAHHASLVRPGPASASWYAPGVSLVRAAGMRGDSRRKEWSGSPGSMRDNATEPGSRVPLCRRRIPGNGHYPKRRRVPGGGILHAISEEFPALRCAGEGDRHARRPACRTLERRRCSRMFVVEAFVVDVGRDEPPGRNDASEARDNLYRQMYMHFRVTKKYFLINRLYQCVGGGGGRGIRTLGTLTRTTVFETAPFDHSGIPPVKSTDPHRATRPSRPEKVLPASCGELQSQPVVS